MRNVRKIMILKKQQGFTMLEALLTLFVLTIGVLGVAGLQIRAMSAGGMAMQRTIVLMKTQELLERMRANKIGLASYAGTGIGTDGDCDDGSTVCNAATVAAHDLWLWRNDLSRLLSASALGATPITVTPGLVPTSPTTIQVTINWTSKTNEQAVATQAQSYSVTTQI